MNKVECDPENWVSAMSCMRAAQIQDHHPHSRKVCRVSSEDNENASLRAVEDSQNTPEIS